MSSKSQRLLQAIRLLALTLMTLHLAAPLFPEAAAWGLWPAVYLPTGWRWGLAVLTAVFVAVDPTTLAAERSRPLRELKRRLGQKIGDWAHASHLPEISTVHGGRFASSWARLALALLTAVPFYLFRIQHLRWGDAYILVKSISHPQVRLTYVWQAPLDVFIHAKIWALGNRLFGWLDPLPVYAILSTVAGVVFVWVLLGLARELGRDAPERILIAGLVLSLGTMQLFFGYIENYTFMTVGVLIYLWLALRTLRGEAALIWPVTALALTHAFHPATIVLTPSLVYLAFAGSARPFPGPNRKEGEMPFQTALFEKIAAFAVPYLLVLAGVLALMTAGGHGIDALLGADFPGGGDRRWFVPLLHTSTRWEHYTMFAPGHLVDVVNEQLLIAPAILPGLILAAIVAWRRLPLHDSAWRFLALSAGLYLLLALTWNPDYGGQRDWDLFAAAALPAALLLGYVLPRVVPERGALKAAGWTLIAAQAYHLIAWVYQNTLPWSW